MKVHIFIFVVIISQAQSAVSLKVATINIWNTMFNWNIRKHRIAEMIKDTDIDVIGLQEVRSHGSYGDQLQELKMALPSKYKWHVFHSANNVTLPEDAIDSHLNKEGLGIISRLPLIGNSVHYLLPGPLTPDRNNRILVHSAVRDDSGTVYNVIVTHLSYHRQQQCSNVADIITFINRKKLTNLILLGDFNTYNDYEYPIKMLTRGSSGSGRGNRCYRSANNINLLETLTDAWPATRPNQPGLTFSNMPSPGLESRPDRILVTPGFTIHTVDLLGNDSAYKHRYVHSIYWSRFTAIVQSAKLSHQGMSGYPCVQDCGPHGSCQCGVCTAGGNTNNCNLPDCDACNATVYKNLVIFSLAVSIIVVHFFYAIILVLTIGAGSYGETMYSILGFNCCLLNPDLCKRNVKYYQRRNRCLRFCHSWPLFKLPPYIQLLVSVIAICFCYFYFRYKFDAILALTFNILPEELFSSDHLMVVAELSMK